MADTFGGWARYAAHNLETDPSICACSYWACTTGGQEVCGGETPSDLQIHEPSKCHSLSYRVAALFYWQVNIEIRHNVKCILVQYSSKKQQHDKCYGQKQI